MSPQPEPRDVVAPRPRWRRWLRRATVSLLVLIAVAVIGYACAHWRFARELDEAVEALDRDDPGWKLEEIEGARTVVPEEENSARNVVASYALLPPDWRRRELLGRLDEIQPNARLGEPLFAALLADLENVRPAVLEARKLVDRPRGRHHLAYKPNVLDTLLDDQERTRVVTRLLAHDATRHAQLGDMKAALRSCCAAVNSGRSLGDEPILISQLLRMACVGLSCKAIERALAQGEPPADEMGRLQRLLEDEDRYPGLLILLRGERALSHSLYAAVESGDVRFAHALDSANKFPTFHEYLPEFARRDLVRAEHPRMLSLMTQRIGAARLPLHEQAARERALRSETADLSMFALLTRRYQPSLARMGLSFRHTRANVRCLIVALAVERHRQRRRDWPGALTDLVPDFLGAVPLDPFDGKPLRYRRLPDGAIIYSVGPDETDNGGAIHRKNPMDPDTDVGCQLWDVGARGVSRPLPVREGARP